jgi:hypothetical protein
MVDVLSLLVERSRSLNLVCRHHKVIWGLLKADRSENWRGPDPDGLDTWLVSWWFRWDCFFVSVLWKVVIVFTVMLSYATCFSAAESNRFVGHQVQGRLSIVVGSITVYCVAVISTNFREESHSWEANSVWSNREIPRFLWNMQLRYFVYGARHLSLPWARRTATMPSNLTYVVL